MRAALAAAAASLAALLATPGTAAAACQAWLRNDTRHPMLVRVLDAAGAAALTRDEVPLGPNGSTRPASLPALNTCRPPQHG